VETRFQHLVERVAERLRSRGHTLVTAESCTGGWVAKVVTDMAGSSQWFDRGFVTYTNTAKQEMLGVGEATLAEHGAVSEATVREMAEGALRHSHGDVSVAISGVAGPGGGSEAKPVGMVCFAWAVAGGNTVSRVTHFEGDREAVRRQAVETALEGVLDVVIGGA
jgi:nicotinamide-nucleotide amidase